MQCITQKLPLVYARPRIFVQKVCPPNPLKSAISLKKYLASLRTLSNNCAILWRFFLLGDWARPTRILPLTPKILCAVLVIVYRKFTLNKDYYCLASLSALADFKFFRCVWKD